jgi:endonuclease YncB( thermonuclease family)
VVHVADGDTLTLLDSNRQQHRVRLAGIDAPEKGQAYGQVAREHLAGLAAGRRAMVEVSKLDRYGRLVGKILGDGNGICLGQIRAGLAWHYKRFEAEQSVEDRGRYAQTEEAARLGGRGLWGDRDPRPPWEYRKRQHRP